MKQTLLVVFLMISGMLCAQATRGKRAGIIVPPAVEQKFVLEYPDTEAQWFADGSGYKAKFINPVNNLGYIIVYEPSGRIVRREKELERDEVPANVGAFLQKHSRGQGFVVWSVTDSTGAQSYYSPNPEGTVVFDRTGLPVSEVNLMRDSLQPATSR